MFASFCCIRAIPSQDLEILCTGCEHVVYLEKIAITIAIFLSKLRKNNSKHISFLFYRTKVLLPPYSNDEKLDFVTHA